VKQRYRKQIQPRSGPEKAFGQALREVREARNLSQEQFAFDAGFDRTFISMLERGVCSPTIRTLVRLARVLKVPASAIVARMERLAKSPKPPKK